MSRSAVDIVRSLPHWARVAFAARCARAVRPLFEAAWPDAISKRGAALDAATSLAEQSACDGLAAEGLESAAAGATITAGGALVGVYGFKSYGDPLPATDHAGYIASFAAKVAEYAAKAADAGPSGSAAAAIHAYSLARDTTDRAEAVAILDRLHADLASLRRVASRGRWTDDTPVPPDVFDLLEDDKPWWAFWR